MSLPGQHIYGLIHLSPDWISMFNHVKSHIYFRPLIYFSRSLSYIFSLIPKITSGFLGVIDLLLIFPSWTVCFSSFSPGHFILFLIFLPYSTFKFSDKGRPLSPTTTGTRTYWVFMLKDFQFLY